MDLEEIKLYLRLDTEDEDDFIRSLQMAAEEYLSNAGAVKDYNPNLYKTAVKMIVSSWYANRDGVSGKDTLSLMFRTIIGQLCVGDDTN